MAQVSRLSFKGLATSQLGGNRTHAPSHWIQGHSGIKKFNLPAVPGAFNSDSISW